MSEELVQANQQGLQIPDDSEADQSLVSVVTFPSYKDVTDKSVLKSVRDVFKGFDPSASDFKTPEALASYLNDTTADIREVRERATAANLCHNAAALARVWYMGNTINNELTSGTYSSNTHQRLANEMHISTSYLYQLRAVARALTVVDCWLLGIRGCDVIHLRRLSDVRDDDTRRAIINAFIDTVKDTGDQDRIKEALSKLKAAANLNQKVSAEELGSTDPLNGGSEVEVSEQFSDLMSNMSNWSKMLKKPSQEDQIESFINACGNFYLMSDVPDAAAHLDEMKSKAGDLKKLALNTKANLEASIRELDSLLNMGLTQADETNNG